MLGMILRSLASLAFTGLLAVGAFAQGWLGYGGNAQHSGLYTGTSQTAALIKWSASIDDDRAYYGGDVLAHYAAPMVTPSNTVVYGYRFTTQQGANHDNWRVMARNGATGAVTWQFDTDYSAALIWPNDWTSVFPVTLYQAPGNANLRGVAAAALGGSIMVRTSADTAVGTPKRLVFYTTLADFNANSAAYAPVKINTPLTADASGNVYFGYEVTGNVPTNLASLGTGGYAKVNVNTGVSSFKSVAALNLDQSLSRPAMNAAPAITVDGKYIYVAITGGNPMMAKLDSKTLMPTASARVLDPSMSGASAGLINESSASPMIGTDGHVFMGVFGNSWRESHGWMLQWDSNLKQLDAKGKRFPVGAFGWDDTGSVVPATMVPSYKGTSKYLILTKYNNYDDNGGDAGADGSNKVAVLDPGSDSISKDRQSGIPVMNEVLTVLGPTLINNDSNHPNARNEWCINSVAVDVARKSAIINSEDGHMYRWSFVTNTLTEGLNLQPATGEAYTETAIGPDGQSYAINNSILFALGTNKATATIASKGSGVSGNAQNTWYLDGSSYKIGSVSQPAGQTVLVEADFTIQASNPTSLNVVSTVSALNGVSGTLYVYNNTTKKFDAIGSQALSTTLGAFNATITSNVGNYIGTGGKVKVQIGGVLPPAIGKAKFTLAIDHVTCGAN